jgi:ArsR family transcriptional regulator
MKNKVQEPKIQTIFRALSDRTRLRILNLLQEGEVCVCHLVEVLDSPQPTISRHLAYLRKSGLVVARKEGLWMHYRLTPARAKSRKMLLACLAECFGEDAKFGEDRTKLRARIQTSCRS